MDIKTRQETRISLLKECYDLYFDANSNSFKRIDTQKLRNEDYEKFLAYDYLLAKNLIKDVRSGGNTPEYQISIYGIDVIESLELKKENE